MKDQILELAFIIYSEGNNEMRDAATSEIIQMGESEEFYGAVLDLIINYPRQKDPHEISNKRSLIIIFEKNFLKYYENFEEEFRIVTMTNFLNILQSVPKDLLYNAINVVYKFVNKFLLYGGWPNLYEYLDSMFESEETYISAAAICATISHELKLKSHKTIEQFSLFSNNFLPKIDVLLQSPDLDIKQLAYHTINRLFYEASAKEIVSLCEKIDMESPDYASICAGIIQTAPTYLQYALNLGEIQRTKQSVKVFVEATKFLSSFSVTCMELLDEDVVGQLLQFIQALFEANVLAKLNCKVIELVYNLATKCNWISIIEGNLEYFLTIFDRFLQFDESEIEKMENDPAAFVINAHMTCNDWNDTRASILRLIKKVTSKSAVVKSALYDHAIATAGAAFEELNVQTLSSFFGAFQMVLGAVSRREDDDEFSAFLENIGSLFDADDFRIRATAFMCVSNSNRSSCCAENLLQTAFEHLGDDSLLVQYYAALTVSSLLIFIKRTESYDEIRQQFSESISEIIEAFLTLCAEFSSEDLTNSLTTLIDFFKADVIQFAPDLTTHMIDAFYTNASSSDSTQNGNAMVIIDTIEILVDIMKSDPKIAGSTIPDLFGKLMEMSEHLLQDDEAIDGIIHIMTKLIITFPGFKSDFWGILNVLYDIFENDEYRQLDSVSSLILHMLDKDKSLTLETASTIAEFTISKATEDDSSAVLNIFAMLCLRLNGAQEFSELVVATYPFIDEAMKEMMYDNGADRLFSSAMVTYGLEGIGMFGEYGERFLPLWAESEEFPMLQAALVKHFNELDSDLALTALTTAIRAVSDQMHADEEDDFAFGGDLEEDGEEGKLGALDDIDEFALKESDAHMSSIDSPSWIDQATTVAQFGALVERIQALPQFEAVIERIDPEQVERVMQDIAKCKEFAATLK